MLGNNKRAVKRRKGFGSELPTQVRVKL